MTRSIPLPRLPSQQPAYSEDAGDFTTLLLVADPQVLRHSTVASP